MVVGGGEFFVWRHTDENDGFGFETFGLVDGGVADAAGAVLFPGAFAEVAAEEDTAVAEEAVGDVRGIAEAGFIPNG